MPRDNSKTSFTQKCLINMDEVTKKGNGNDKKNSFGKLKTKTLQQK